MTHHTKSRIQHPKYTVARVEVPDNRVDWSQPFDNYIDRRPFYMHPEVERNLALEKTDSKRWAEAPTISLNDKELLKTRITYINGTAQTLEEANIIFDGDNAPVNPKGRTGIYGPGLLGKNGPNQAADPIFTRWAPFNVRPFIYAILNLMNLFIHGPMMVDIIELVWQIICGFFLMCPHLEMIAIQRWDTRDLAIPGGMVEAGQTVSKTLRNELYEEAFNKNPDNTYIIAIDKILSEGRMIYIGYVDDPRNTDSRWMETTAVHFHCPAKIANKINLEAGDDARKAIWLPMNPFDMRYKKLYASHKQITDRLIIQVYTSTCVYNIIVFMASYIFVNELLEYFM
jgi:ADP-ribose pyrophosphatase